jgi:DNA-binding MarR family transcriptional regulator
MTSTAHTSTDLDLDVAARLRTAVTRLNRRLRQQSLGGISPAQASMLAMADRLGTPTLGELAKAEQIQPPTTTRLVAQMEDAGLLARLTDEKDKRVCRVEVTPAGRRELKRIRNEKTAYLVDRLESLDESERLRAVELVELLERLEHDR